MAFINKNITNEYFDQYRNGGDERLNTLSQQYDSLRTYSWLISIGGLGDTTGAEGSPRDQTNSLTLACKQVGAIGFQVEDIAVDRVNDKFYYPGKYSADETTLTFDNLVTGEAANALFGWISETYDPTTGVLGTSAMKRKIQITQLDADHNPKMMITLYGAYAKFYRLAELNYSTNDFHTIEVGVRFDFALQEMIG
tara:strand:+ start:705 stop:1292 length:588 start_codon:yes stop_codon:yes gene_type:complete